MRMILDCVHPCRPYEKSRFLDAIFTPAEVRKTIFDMALTKTPGLDGLPTFFYQKYWPIVGEKVTSACLGVLNHGFGLEAETLIVMISKVKRAVRMLDFHPISLRNVTYKIVAKTLANRLRTVIDDVISET
ncbi:hypothetical protein Ddye_030216 [Dipteronia dyeriana]|uniref:Reverse transcriptase n=1 Tax=Dipteronia dyeriana TaxID=168575 RepID=A0AAD9TFY1_9ROSI|nr:hypothetical protein Ddye_030216 [Dipteronia dyeriana]